MSEFGVRRFLRGLTPIQPSPACGGRLSFAGSAREMTIKDDKRRAYRADENAASRAPCHAPVMAVVRAAAHGLDVGRRRSPRGELPQNSRSEFCNVCAA
jgi:hypothetical protein